MKNRIIEICELGQPKSIIQRENEPITELIKTDSLIEELNKQLLLHNVSQQRELLRIMEYLSTYWGIDEVIDCTKHLQVIEQYKP